jgi:hypothetical protein
LLPQRREVATVVLGGIAAMALGARWHRMWGATDEEAAERLPGDGLVPVAEHQTTRATTIDRSPTDVWPWLAQMGQGRGGLYTYEWIENALGAQIRNLDRIDPELQDLKVGDSIRLTPEVYLGRLPGQFYRVEEVQLREALTMLQELPGGSTSSWSFVLRALPDNRTRLLVRGRTSPKSGFGARLARRVELLLLEPGYFVMERGMLHGIKRRAEAAQSPIAT